MSGLVARRVDRKLKEYDRIMKMVLSTFPKEDLFPLWYLRLLTHRKGIDFTAYYDGDLFCGFTFTVKTQGMLYLLYLAVNPEIRSKGYGSVILQQLKSENADMTISLDVEPPDSSAENSVQRERRLSFYSRNGFYVTHLMLRDNGGSYLVLACGGEFSEKAYRKAIRRLFFVFNPTEVLST